VSFARGATTTGVPTNVVAESVAAAAGDGAPIVGIRYALTVWLTVVDDDAYVTLSVVVRVKEFEIWYWTGAVTVPENEGRGVNTTFPVAGSSTYEPSTVVTVVAEQFGTASCGPHNLREPLSRTIDAGSTVIVCPPTTTGSGGVPAESLANGVSVTVWRKGALPVSLFASGAGFGSTTTSIVDVAACPRESRITNGTSGAVPEYVAEIGVKVTTPSGCTT
jgi:hypothetical protein